MVLRFRSILLFAIVAILAMIAAAWHSAHSQPVNPPPVPIPVDSTETLVAEIGKCLKAAKEVLLFDDYIYCMLYRTAHDLIEEKKLHVPQQLTFDRFCSHNPTDQPNAHEKNTNNIRFSARVLTTDIIVALLNGKPRGVRIFGAVFCNTLDIVGLDLSSSLVIDHSLFKNGIEIRNLQMRGDLSFDNSIVFNYLKILRSKINGSVYGDDAFIDRLEITNTTVDGSVSLGESVLFHSTEFDNAVITRELNIRGSILSYLIIQFSKISGLLDLSHSEARCAYHVNKSEIGFLVAKRAGFGTVETSSPTNSEIFYSYNWTTRFTPSVRSTVESSEVSKLMLSYNEREHCKNEFKRNYISEFFIFDSKITSSLCIGEFSWLSPKNNDFRAARTFFQNNIHDPEYTPDDYLRTVIAISGNVIGNNFIVDLWPSEQRQVEDKSADDETLKPLHMFEAIGVKAGALIIDFKDSSRQYFTLLDGLKFNRVHNAHAVCEYGGNAKTDFVKRNRKLSIISDFSEQLKLPTIHDVLDWLDLNESGSTQPYTAFAEAFEAAGMDSTRIKVARANRELCERATNWFTSFIEGTCRNFTSPRPQNKSHGGGLTHAGNGASRNLCDRANDWFLANITNSCPDVARRIKENHGKPDTNVQSLIPTAFASTDTSFNRGSYFPNITDASKETGKVAIPSETLSDFALLMFRSGLWAIADHGYRPGKVLWWVTGTLILYWLFFLVGLRAVLFLPKSGQASPKETGTISGKPTSDEANPKSLVPISNTDGLKKINLLFLFDRLIPSYKISEKNYDIVRYFRWISKSEADKIGQGALSHRGYIYHYVREVNEKEHSWIEKSLLVLRLLGVIYTIFLAAAVSALIVR